MDERRYTVRNRRICDPVLPMKDAQIARLAKLRFSSRLTDAEWVERGRLENMETLATINPAA